MHIFLFLKPQNVIQRTDQFVELTRKLKTNESFKNVWATKKICLQKYQVFQMLFEYFDTEAWR